MKFHHYLILKHLKVLLLFLCFSVISHSISIGITSTCLVDTAISMPAVASYSRSREDIMKSEVSSLDKSELDLGLGGVSWWGFSPWELLPGEAVLVVADVVVSSQTFRGVRMDCRLFWFDIYLYILH